MTNRNFAVFILSHGRANHVLTLNTLQKQHYTGKIFIVIDDEDDQEGEYYKNFGDMVVQFHKKPVVDATDTMDLLNEHCAIVYARNEIFNIAKKLGITHFLMLDDDVYKFHFKYIKDKETLLSSHCTDLDSVFEVMLNFLDDTNCDTIAFCQGGDLVGGMNNNRIYKGLLRKAMNSFFCRTDRPIKFSGTLNEDVVTYTTLGSRGVKFFTTLKFMIIPEPTQSSNGGMTDVYLEKGTYVKSFYAVMSMPSAVKVSMFHTTYARIHHSVFWENCVPKILNEKYKK